jgi:type IV pilus assembly protein PilW
MNAMRASFRGSRGFSLVELLVAVAINLVVVVAASYLYLATRESQRVAAERAMMFENGNFALEIIGRELENAGFFPAVSAFDISRGATFVATYENPVTGVPAAFNRGLFGCDATSFLPSTSACGAHAGSPTPDADAMVVNYFTNDAMSLDVGQRADCQRQDVSVDPTNSTRVGTSTATGVPPTVPLFVSNRYTLIPTTVRSDTQTISTFALACNGNGVAAQVDTYQALVSGIEQLRFRYGTFSVENPFQPDAFLTAAGVSALGTVSLGPETRAGWGRVIAVRACLLVRTMQPAKVSRASYTLNDCDGTAQTYTDGVERKVMTQVFAVKNHIPQTYSIN